APGRVVGVATETGLVLLTLTSGGSDDLLRLLQLLDDRGAPGKQLRYEAPRGASLVLSLENLHDFPALRRDLAQQFPAATVREGLGAVSAIGAGINARFASVRECLRLLAKEGMTVLGLATSRFRVSLLLEAAAVEEAARLLHRELVEG